MKIKVLILISILVIGKMARAQTWIPLDNSAANTPPTITVVESNASRYVIDIRIHGLYRTDVVKNGNTYHKLTIDGDRTLPNIGEPALPVLTQLIGLPVGNNCTTSIVERNWINLDMGKIYPYQRHLLETEEETSFQISSTAYNMNMYNSEIVYKGNVMTWKGVNNVSFSICPFKYYPSSDKLSVLTDFRFVVDFNTPATSQSRIQSINMQNNELVIFDNAQVLYSAFDDLDTDTETDSNNYDYLIIIGNNSTIQNSQALKDFCLWKAYKGYKTKVVSTTTIGTTSAAIKNYIKQEYNSNGISYVLFVGDDDRIPLYNWPCYYGSSYSKSDYWYGCMDGDNDIQGDVAIGRFSTNTLSEFENMVNKTIKYESEPNANYSKVLLVAHKENAPGKYQNCSEEIRTATYEAPMTFYTAYGASTNNGGNNATNTDVINRINTGLNILNYRGHGSFSAWDSSWSNSGVGFSATQVGQLTNTSFPIVFGIACQNGNIRNQTCLLESFTRSSHGAAIFLGATENSYTIPNHSYDKILFDELLNNNIYNIGMLNISSHIKNYSQMGGVSTAIDNTFCYVIGGDPSLEIWTGEPKTFDNVTITRNSNTIVVSTGNVQGFNVSVVSPSGELLQSEYSSGTSITLTNVSDNCNIAINKHDYVTFVDDILYIQNETVTGTNIYDANTIKVGSNVTTSKSTGEVNFNSGNITLTGKNIELNKGTNIANGVNFEIIIKQ